MVDAEIVVHAEGERVEWGRWSFAALPMSGHKLGLRAGDGTLVYFRVRDVEHRPVRAAATGAAAAIIICDWEGEDLLDAETEELLNLDPSAR